MGMFTSITHPEDGRELQIKCGWDQCKTYLVGDTVGQYPIEWCAGEGYLLDDVYDSYSNRGKDAFVVIKDGRVAAVIEREDATAIARRHFPQEEEIVGGDCIQALRVEWDIQSPPKEWWNEASWAKRVLRLRLR